MLCWVCCNTEPNAIKSLAGVRFSDCEYPSPKYDASATALGGAFEISVKMFLNLTGNQVARKVTLFFCNLIISLFVTAQVNYHVSYLFLFDFLFWLFSKQNFFFILLIFTLNGNFVDVIESKCHNMFTFQSSICMILSTIAVLCNIYFFSLIPTIVGSYTLKQKQKYM